MASKRMTTVLKEKTEIVVPPSLQRQAGFKIGDRLEFRVSGGIITITPEPPSADDEYTPEQRQVIDARLAKADEDIKGGRVHGPFNSAEEASAYIERLAKERTAAKKIKRPSR
jgi:bifunctional DNA-binding transcriptional regulator/antitoxin component of YhaV-PrlF toxin-antitoxin module